MVISESETRNFLLEDKLKPARSKKQTIINNSRNESSKRRKYRTPLFSAPTA